jgi:predicted metal-dependent HD superfamily phosphohydrolase
VAPASAGVLAAAGLTAVVTELCDRFAALVRRLGAEGDVGPLAAELVAAWSEPSRRYHDPAHLRDCLNELDRAPAERDTRDLVEAALWFHDAVHDVSRSDNEQRSAAWARSALMSLGTPPAVADEVARLVLVTRHDRPSADPAGQLIADVDLSVLGRAPGAFDAYDRAIRAEYALVPDEEYRAGRHRILSQFLDRSPLYLTPYFRGRYEASARANLTRALARLRERA